MTTQPENDISKTFCVAITEADWETSQAALGEYFTWFRSQPRTIQEVESARKLLEWAMQTAGIRKARIAEELVTVNRVFGGYAPSHRSHGWLLDG